jgi:hypothetical protein
MISIKNNAVNNIYHFKPTPEETVDEVCIGILFIVFVYWHILVFVYYHLVHLFIISRDLKGHVSLFIHFASVDIILLSCF